LTRKSRPSGLKRPRSILASLIAPWGQELLKRSNNSVELFTGARASLRTLSHQGPSSWDLKRPNSSRDALDTLASPFDCVHRRTGVSRMSFEHPVATTPIRSVSEPLARFNTRHATAWGPRGRNITMDVTGGRSMESDQADRLARNSADLIARATR